MNKVCGEKFPLPGGWGRDGLGLLLCPSLWGCPWHCSQGRATPLMTVALQTSSATPGAADTGLNLEMQERALRGDKKLSKTKSDLASHSREDSASDYADKSQESEESRLTLGITEGKKKDMYGHGGAKERAESLNIERCPPRTGEAWGAVGCCVSVFLLKIFKGGACLPTLTAWSLRLWGLKLTCIHCMPTLGVKEGRCSFSLTQKYTVGKSVP